MIVLGFLSAVVVGTLLLMSMKRDALPLTLQNLALAFGLGMGTCGVITFLSLSVHAYHPPLISALWIVLLLGLAFRLRSSDALRPAIWFVHGQTAWRQFRLIHALYLIAITTAGIVIYYLASTHPFGEWDGWGMWNLKAKFLILSPNPMQDVLRELHWHTHPDYPLLLPSILAFLHSFQGDTLFPVPLLNAWIWPLATTVLLYGSLCRGPRPWIAMAASLALITHPFFVFTGTSQYADVILGFYLLAALFCTTEAFRSAVPSSAILAGAFMGLLSFTKNEGIALAVLIGIGAGVYLWRHRRCLPAAPLVRGLLFGILIWGAATVLFKGLYLYYHTPLTPGLVPDAVEGLTWNRAATIARLMWQELGHEKWCYLWYLLPGIAALRWKRLMSGFIPYGLLVIGAYLLLIFGVYFFGIANEAAWWVSTSFPRILFAIWPSLLFLLLYPGEQTEPVQTENTAP